MKKQITLLLLIVSLAVGCLAQTPAPVKNSFYAMNSWDATGVLIKNGRMICSGAVVQRLATGFRFLTARHCVADKEGFVISFASDQRGPFYEVDPDSVRISDADDLAYMDAHSENGAPAYAALGDEYALKAGDPIEDVSYPGSLGKTRTTGTFIQSRLNYIPEFLKPYHWEEAMPADIAIAHGSSGSPLFSVDEKAIIGVVVGKIDDISIIIPVSRVKHFFATKADQLVPGAKPKSEDDEEN